METKTKINLTNEEIQTLLSHNFGSQTLLTEVLPLKDGWFNTAYMLTLSDTARMVLKIAPLPSTPILTYEKNIMRAEVDVMQRVSAQGKAPVPAFLAVDFSRTILPSDYYFMQPLQGQTLDKVEKTMSPADKESIEEQKGRIAAYFHQIHNSFFGYPVWQGEAYTQTWRDAFLQIITNILVDAETFHVRLPKKPENIWKIYQKHASLLEEVKTPVLLHFDYWSGNIFVKGQPGNYEIEGITDFERAIWGDAIAELVIDIGADLEKWKGSPYMRGYEEVSGQPIIFDESARTRFLMYKAYLAMIMVIECAPRSYPLPLHTWIKTYIYQNLKQILKELE